MLGVLGWAIQMDVETATGCLDCLDCLDCLEPMVTAASGNSVEVLETLDDAVADVGGAVGALSVALVALVALVASDALAAEGGAACADALVDALVDASVGVEGFGAAAVAFAGVLLAAHVDALVVASAWVVACDAAVHASFASSLGLTVLDQNHLGIVSVASLVVAVGAQLGPGVRQRTASGPLGPLGPLGLLGLEVLELMVPRP
mmetsp:Transcript_34584/g.74599  ORF Transcript_34584/g.74599 Transcript_34584/m.74599 type:complete len:205 (-) Transcript_34584:482-1096(-)